MQFRHFGKEETAVSQPHLSKRVNRFNFRKTAVKFGGVAEYNLFKTINMFVMGKVWQVGEVGCVIVAKNQRLV